MKKFILILFGIIIGILIIELSLAAGSAAIGIYWGLKNSGNAAVKIIALGESTTADMLNGQVPWPEQLEHVLNNRSNTTYKVINLGKGGTNTAYIASKLHAYIDKYDPDIVITMMGINDEKLTFVYNDRYTPRVVKLFRWITDSLRKSEERTDDPYLKSGEVYFAASDFSNALLEFNESIRNKPSWKAYARAGAAANELSRHAEARDYLLHAYYLNPDDEWTTTELAWTNMRLNLSTSLIPPEFSSTANDFPEITRLHYLRIQEALEEENITYIAMQYPTYAVSGLAGLFNNGSQVIFVSNEANFAQALEMHGYDYLFLDRAGTTFGHATTEGNRLIAEAAAEKILR